jgi:hypothetical protein
MNAKRRECFFACICNRLKKHIFFSAHNLSKQNKTSIFKPFLRTHTSVFNRFLTFIVDCPELGIFCGVLFGIP